MQRPLQLLLLCSVGCAHQRSSLFFDASKLRCFTQCYLLVTSLLQPADFKKSATRAHRCTEHAPAFDVTFLHRVPAKHPMQLLVWERVGRRRAPVYCAIDTAVRGRLNLAHYKKTKETTPEHKNQPPFWAIMRCFFFGRLASLLCGGLNRGYLRTAVCRRVTCFAAVLAYTLRTAILVIVPRLFPFFFLALTAHTAPAGLSFPCLAVAASQKPFLLGGGGC